MTNPVDGGWLDRLTHLASQAYFVFGEVAPQYRLRYRSGDGPIEERVQHSWPGVLNSVELFGSGASSPISTCQICGAI